MKLLEVESLNVYYGGIHAIKNVNFDIYKGEIVSLIGANGAGKTTILHTISGLVQPKTGQISLNGIDIKKKKAHQLISMGMAHTPEGRRIFTELTVLENLELGGYTRSSDEVRKGIKKLLNYFQD